MNERSFDLAAALAEYRRRHPAEGGSCYRIAVGPWAGAYRAGPRALQRLSEMDYLPRSAYENRALPAPTFWLCVLGNGVLAGLLVVSLLRVRS
jgi:hypothetical protein